MTIDDLPTELPPSMKRTFEEAAEACSAAFDRIELLEAFISKVFANPKTADVDDGWIDGFFDFSEEDRGLVHAVRRNIRLSVCTSCGRSKPSDSSSKTFQADPGGDFDFDWDGCSAGSGT